MKSVEYQLLSDENGQERALLLLNNLGVFYRDSGDWVPLDDDDDMPFELEQLTAQRVTSDSISQWDGDGGQKESDEDIAISKIASN